MRGCRPLTDPEVAQVAASFTGPTARRDRALFLLGIRSGFRISELLSLQVGDVYQQGRVVERVSVARRHMKKKVEGRTVVLHPEAKAAISAWLVALGLDAPPETPLFRSRQGGSKAMDRTQAWRILESAYAACGLSGKLGTHSLRKTFANRVYEALDHDLVRTQRALGHRNVNSTVAYLAFREEEIDAAILAS